MDGSSLYLSGRFEIRVYWKGRFLDLKGLERREGLFKTEAYLRGKRDKKGNLPQRRLSRERVLMEEVN